MKPQHFEGGCLCGELRYEIKGDLFVSFHCHCTDCRRASGAAFLTWSVFPRSKSRWISGTPKTFKWASRHRMFCGTCGTSIAALPSLDAEVFLVTTATLDDHTEVKPAAHNWCCEKLPWINLGSDNLPQNDTGGDD